MDKQTSADMAAAKSENIGNVGKDRIAKAIVVVTLLAVVLLAWPGVAH
jgi:hypothetical protein